MKKLQDLDVAEVGWQPILQAHTVTPKPWEGEARQSLRRAVQPLAVNPPRQASARQLASLVLETLFLGTRV